MAPEPLVTVDDVERVVPGLLAALEEAFPERDFLAELAELVPPAHMTPPPSTAERAAGVHFSPAHVIRFLRFARQFRHTKTRRWAGKPFELDLWQIVYVVGPVFGWLTRDGYRYHTTAFVEVPRKNGKSTLASVIGLYLLTADGEDGAEVICGAKDRDQAHAVFSVALQMVEGSRAASKRIRLLKSRQRMFYDRTNSEWKVIASDKKGEAKHGLNLHGGIIDELHVIKDADLIDAIETGTGSRDQPLILFITTAGIPEDNAVWVDKRDAVIKAAARVIDLAGTWGVIWAAPPACAEDGTWRDPETWRRANPGFGVSVRPEYLEKKAREAEVSPRKLSAFLRLHLNVPTTAATTFIGLGTWDRSASIVDELDLRGGIAFGGLDLSSSLDLSALALVFPDRFPDFEFLDVVMRFWTPSDTMTERSHLDRADYPLWARQGFLRATDGETIDYDVIERDVSDVLDAFEVRSIDYDPWGSKQLRTHLEGAGARIGECRQGYGTLSAPTKELEKLTRERRLRHGGHPVLRYCVSGLAVVQDDAGNVKPSRRHSRSRIDGAVALIMALNGFMRAIKRGSSVYEDRGLEVAGQ